MHHVGVVVKDLSQGLRTYETLFRASKVGPVVDDTIQQAQICFMELPGNRVLVELVAPYSDSAPVANFLERYGGGLHHVCYVTQDIEKVRKIWRTGGAIPVFGPAPAAAFAGHSVMFMYLRDRSLVELVEADPEASPKELLVRG